MMSKFRVLFAVLGALVLSGAFAAPAMADSNHITTKWAPGAPTGDGGPSCDVDNDGVDDSYYNPSIPFEYRLIGDLDGDVFEGQYVQRFTDAPYSSSEPPVGWPADILVTGQVRNIGTIVGTDFSDVSTLQPIGVQTLRWNYRITDVEGNHLASTGGRIEVDFAAADPIISLRSHGPCTQP
jgi:hypothetical protein